jgi:YjbE family integral membrane protein
MEALQTADFWIGLVRIGWINILLSGDNAVVIALAARALPERQQRTAVFWGSAAAVVLRIVLTVVAARLLALPYLQIVGGLLLLWIGIQLLVEDDEGEGDELHHHTSPMAAIRTILVADVVMSLDNVIAVAAASEGSMLLLVLGLAISIPLVVFGATLMVKLMERFPAIVVAGAGLIGWVAGETIASDTEWAGLVGDRPWMHDAAAATGAFIVIAIGRFMQARGRSRAR